MNPTPIGVSVSKEAIKLAAFSNDTSDDVMLKVATTDASGKKMN